MDLKNLTIAKIHEGLLNKDFTSAELTKAYLKRIEEKDSDISAFITVSHDLAIAQAEEADKRIASGKGITMLTGVPCAIKDNILIDQIKCTGGSKILEEYVAPYNATVIKRLKEHGVVFLGKTNLDEFAMGSSTENSAFKKTHNPIDLSRVPGGSSGGSAAAVAASECCFALGSDTGGSIRQPASFCGVFGFKPTYGAVSRYGLMAFASSLDQIGPIAKNSEDARIVFEAISGRDPQDSTSVEYKFNKEDLDFKKIKVGIPKEYFVKGMDPEVEKIVRRTIDKIEAQGAQVQEISLPHTEYALACYYIVAPAEASANLARYDGIKYGLSKTEDELLGVYLKTRGYGFGAEVKRRIMLGTYTLSSGYYDAYYLKAQEVRDLIREDFKKAFSQVDFIITPVCPTPAFKIGEKTEDPLSMYLADIFTIAVNLAGLPAISMPCGEIDKLPVGLQVIGKHFEDSKVLGVSSLIEKLVVK